VPARRRQSARGPTPSVGARISDVHGIRAGRSSLPPSLPQPPAHPGPSVGPLPGPRTVDRQSVPVVPGGRGSPRAQNGTR